MKKIIIYSNIHLGFYSKTDYLVEHQYNILIDNELRHIKATNENEIATILYAPYDENYEGL